MKNTKCSGGGLELPSRSYRLAASFLRRTFSFPRQSRIVGRRTCQPNARRASAVSNSHRIRHFHTIAHPVSRNGSPERSPLPPRVVPVTGYTGLCADCLRAAVTSHGSRRRAASGSSSRHRRTSDESFMRTLARHASLRLWTGFSASTAWWAWRTRPDLALPSRTGPEDARERRAGQSREGLPTHRRMPRRPRETKRVVAIVTLPEARGAPGDRQNR